MAATTDEPMLRVTLIQKGDDVDISLKLRTLWLKPGTSWIIGRSSLTEYKGYVPASSNAYYDCKVMSRRHAKLEATNGYASPLLLTDISKHGTFINGKKMKRNEAVTLGRGDRIKFAEQLSTASASDKTHKPVEVRLDYNYPNERYHFDIGVTRDVSQPYELQKRGFCVPSTPDSERHSILDDEAASSHDRVNEPISDSWNGVSPLPVSSHRQFEDFIQEDCRPEDDVPAENLPEDEYPDESSSQDECPEDRLEEEEDCGRGDSPTECSAEDDDIIANQHQGDEAGGSHSEAESAADCESHYDLDNRPEVMSDHEQASHAFTSSSEAPEMEAMEAGRERECERGHIQANAGQLCCSDDGQSGIPSLERLDEASLKMKSDFAHMIATLDRDLPNFGFRAEEIMESNTCSAETKRISIDDLVLSADRSQTSTQSAYRRLSSDAVETKTTTMPSSAPSATRKPRAPRSPDYKVTKHRTNKAKGPARRGSVGRALRTALSATAYAALGSIATIGFLASPLAERLAGV